MTWTPVQLKAAYLALSPTPASLEAAAATLNAQTTTVTVPVPIASVAAYLGLVGKLGAIETFATSPPSGASAQSVAAAQGLWEMIQSPAAFPPFDMPNPTVAAEVEAMLAALVSPGTGVTAPIDSTDQATILGLASQTVSVWQPAVTAGDVQTALALIP